ncbi:MAG: hypothetical protein SGILL_002977 [Bacillariaceae sp.]
MGSSHSAPRRANSARGRLGRRSSSNVNNSAAAAASTEIDQDNSSHNATASSTLTLEANNTRRGAGNSPTNNNSPATATRPPSSKTRRHKRKKNSPVKSSEIAAVDSQEQRTVETTPPENEGTPRKTGREYFEDYGEEGVSVNLSAEQNYSNPDVLIQNIYNSHRREESSDSEENDAVDGPVEKSEAAAAVTPSPSQDNPTWIPPVYTPVENPEYSQDNDYNYGYQGPDDPDYGTQRYPDYYTPQTAADAADDQQQQQQQPYYDPATAYYPNLDDVNFYGPPPPHSNSEYFYMMTPPPQSNTAAATAVPDFFPQGSPQFEWMGRSLETLLLNYGHQQVAPILCLPEDEDKEDGDTAYATWGGATRRRSTVSTLGSGCEYRNSMGSMGGAGGGRRGSFFGSSNNGRRRHGGTSANYYNNRRRGGGDPSDARRGSNNSGGGGGGVGMGSRRGSMTGGGAGPANRRGSASHGPSYRQHRRMSNISRSNSHDSEDVARGVIARPGGGGPNVALSLLARETTGRLTRLNPTPETNRLKSLGGYVLFDRLDRPAAGMCSELAFLVELIERGDWSETQTVISRIAPRLIGDPSAATMHDHSHRSPVDNDPNLPPTAPKFYAGGGRVGLERDAFVLAGGVDVLIRVFREPSFVGAEMARTYDARDLMEELVATRLAPCWNEILACIRELAYAIPSLVESQAISDNDEFLPFLFTLLSHDSCFDGAAALIEEILSLQSHSQPSLSSADEDCTDENGVRNGPKTRVPPPTTFFLGNVPDLYKLWASFNCRQLAHFCRILALLVFEPEDRQLLESPAVLKSIELLQLRRNRAARAGRDSTVDMNQSILLGDELLLERLLQLLGVMNYAPPLRESSPVHVMVQNPFIPDTLVMLGLKELTDWQEATRLDGLARALLRTDENENQDDGSESNGTSSGVCGLGAVAGMLENLSRTLSGSAGDPSTQLGQIIHVIQAAQQAGVVVGRSRPNRSEGAQEDDNGHADDPVSILRDQVLSSTLSAPISNGADQYESQSTHQGRLSGSASHTPSDAANVLQFNAILLGTFQVEVLFVLCTLLGGRRKIDTQEMLKRRGIIPILDDMFERLPWNSLSPSRATVAPTAVGRERPTGIHGPGCECTPESALCVQYLRLLHNFCDRDCDNYDGRRLLLSAVERRAIFENPISTEYDIARLSPGLLSKVIAAFVGESDESPYRFWLASCVESYLRGSSAAEQVFVVRTGLLSYLMGEITSQRLHCAGSLQTSFDLLGELCKGNTEVLRILVSMLDEEKFRRLMSVAAANLVDSNVFIRSLILSLERISAANNFEPLHLDVDRYGAWKSPNGTFSRSYLTHTWWDTRVLNAHSDDGAPAPAVSDAEHQNDSSRPSDWYPSKSTVDANGGGYHAIQNTHSAALHGTDVGHFGWVFTPEGDDLSPATHAPNTVERLSWFVAANQTRLLRDLLGVVDLQNINHENICCLNTAVVVAIFANRRQQLHSLLQDLKRMNAEEHEQKRRADHAAAAAREDDVIDRAFVQAMKYMAIDLEHPPAPYARRASLTRRGSVSFNGGQGESAGDRNDIMRNFREVLWFWNEYYAHRGRDRLSLEFSSHLRFQEWTEVVSLLAADNGSPTSLVSSPLSLPRSPYQRSA